MKSDPRNKLLLQYAGLATQLMVLLVLAIYGGVWADKKLNIKFPLFIWIMPVSYTHLTLPTNREV